MKRLFILLAAAIIAAGAMAQPPHHHDQRHDPRHEHGHVHHHAPEPPQIICATPKQLSITLQVLEKQSFDDKKLEIAQLAVTLGHFCVYDLARMAQLFSFDENRLAFLQYAHAYCQDPQNYPALRDVFKFQSNYDELIRSIYMP